MNVTNFRRLFKDVNAVYHGDYIVFMINKHKWELYNRKTEETEVFKSFDQLVNNDIVINIIENYVQKAVRLDAKGSRGDAHDTFGNDDGPEPPKKPSRKDFPSRVNVDKRQSSEEKTLQQFRKLHANDSKEHGFTVDEQGFVHTYRHGGKNSVNWQVGEINGMMVYHNHPSGSAFSKNRSSYNSHNKS